MTLTIRFQVTFERILKIIAASKKINFIFLNFLYFYFQMQILIIIYHLFICSKSKLIHLLIKNKNVTRKNRTDIIIEKKKRKNVEFMKS